MAALRNLFIRAMGGSLPLDKRVVPISPRVVRAPSRALQIIARTDEVHGVASIQENPAGNLQPLGSKPWADSQHLNRQAAEVSVALLQGEIDLRFATVERIVAEQAESLRSLHDLALAFESKMSSLSRSIEALSVKAGSENLEMMSEEQRAEVAKRKTKAMFAFAENGGTGSEPTSQSESEPESQPPLQPALPADPVHFVSCPVCLSQNTRPARRLSVLDKCLRAVSLNPRRCRTCGSRFYRILWAASVDLF